MPRRKSICIDFDGVIHSYKTPWMGPTEIPDPPVEGAFRFIKALLGDVRFQPCIYSSRSQHEGGIRAMQQWMRRHDFPPEMIPRIGWPTSKPPASVYIDDRGFQFNGVFPALDELDEFEPWNKKEGPGQPASDLYNKEGDYIVQVDLRDPEYKPIGLFKVPRGSDLPDVILIREVNGSEKIFEAHDKESSPPVYKEAVFTVIEPGKLSGN